MQCVYHNGVTHLLQRDDGGRCISHYNEIMVVVCYNRDLHLLQEEVQALYSYKSFTSVTIREEWKVHCK